MRTHTKLQSGAAKMCLGHHESACLHKDRTFNRETHYTSMLTHLYLFKCSCIHFTVFLLDLFDAAETCRFLVTSAQHEVGFKSCNQQF